MRAEVPRTAIWLLDRFGFLQQNESLMGDLVEERASGRSALWFWLQTVVALADMVARDLRNHKALVVRAIATGWLLNIAWRRAFYMLGYRYELSRHHTLWTVLSLFDLFCWPAIVGWAVARTHRAQQAAMVLAYATSIAIEVIFALAYFEMKHINDVLITTGVAIASIALLATLFGGFLSKPHRRFSNG